MFPRALAFAALFLAASQVHAQEALTSNLRERRAAIQTTPVPTSAWLDLRQSAGAHSTPQNAPAWVESVNLATLPARGEERAIGYVGEINGYGVPLPAREGERARTIFRIRVSHPRADLQLLLFRLFFEDKPEQRPSIIAWDESGTQVLRSQALGEGIDLPTSETIILPMIGVSCLDVEVAGDGTTIRGVFMDWMTSGHVAHPLSVERREVIPEPFAAAAPLRAPARDTETFGAVTATLAPETIRIGASVQHGAAFQFGLETQPLMALVTFEVSTARIDAPPEIFLNGENLGAVSLTLPELADPAYRGETERLVRPMHFRYTGWLRAQKLVPGANLRVGSNDLLITAGPGTPASAIRATQIQLKYLWDKADYLLLPER